MRSGYWQDLTTSDFAGLDAESTVALLPVAAVEQHGPHLPLATDAVIAEGLVRAALERLPAGARLLVLPTLSVGHSPEHAAFPGTLSVRHEALLDVWLDVGRSVARAGLKKLLILNTHGGQRSLLDLTAMRLRAELGMLAVRASYFAFGAPSGLFEERELRFGLHGGETETSLMLRLRPDLVRIEALRDFKGLPEAMAGEFDVLGVEKPIGFGWMSQDLNAQGVCGNAARADAAKGEEYLDFLTDRLVKLVEDVAAAPLEMLREGPPRDRRGG